MYIDILLLHHLMIKPKHGYEVKKQLERLFADTIRVNNNMLYPSLRKFEQMGAIAKEVDAQPGKPSRHMYAITELGKKMFHKLLREFPPEFAAHENEFIIRVSLFDYLQLPEQQAILNARTDYLRSQLEIITQGQSLTEGKPFAMSTFQFLIKKLQNELDWIETLNDQLYNYGGGKSIENKG